MSTDVLIHRCSLRIARRGGWSWGADPRSLLRAAMLRLPQLVTARLGELWPDTVQCELAAPLRLRIPLRLDDLIALAGGVVAGEAPAASALEVALAHRIDQVLRPWVEREAGQAAEARPAAEAPLELAPAPPPPDPHVLWAGSVLAVLLGWERRGSLQAQLLSFAPASLAAWHQDLLRAHGMTTVTSEAPLRDAVLAVAAECAALSLPLPPSLRAVLIRRITFVVQCAQQFGLRPGEPLLLEALRVQRAFDLPAIDAPAQMAPAAEVPLASTAVLRGAVDIVAPAAALRAPLPPPARSSARMAADVDVASALPFLLLGPLARTGYLLTVRAAFEAAQLLPQLPCFAMALARKVLAPPQRGWLRSADAVIAARTFAGDATPPEDAELAALSRQLAPQLSPLDAVVAEVLTAGHTPGSRLLLQAAPSGGRSGWLLLEQEGLFAIAWAEHIELLYARLAALGHELLLVPAEAEYEEAVERLQQAGFGCVRLPEVPEESAALWPALTTHRPGLPVGSDPAVERSLALAAALALGTLAWTLWRQRESVTPLLALERFADLGAHVSFRPDRVEVHLPLGRRFLDLQRAGLLADVKDVPWFGGRPLRFTRA